MDYICPAMLRGVADAGSAWVSIRPPHLAIATYNYLLTTLIQSTKAAFWCSIYQAAVGPDSQRRLFLAASVGGLFHLRYVGIPPQGPAQRRVGDKRRETTGWIGNEIHS